ncbi:hypothetical protein [Priestia endophytica]|uniref:hypothetical protein n=1 Tax=Priestia endophytica TaxID=135735 RepID=UPI0022800BD4|nr:hypothetical protein [Priestia endophytica]MCY8234657.1 hypothetical protein [Priestia endophytica]
MKKVLSIFTLMMVVAAMVLPHTAEARGYSSGARSHSYSTPSSSYSSKSTSGYSSNRSYSGGTSTKKDNSQTSTNSTQKNSNTTANNKKSSTAKKIASYAGAFGVGALLGSMFHPFGGAGTGFSMFGLLLDIVVILVIVWLIKKIFTRRKSS